MYDFTNITGLTQADLIANIQTYMSKYMTLVEATATSLLYQCHGVYIGLCDNGVATSSSSHRLVLSVSAESTFESDGTLTNYIYKDDTIAPRDNQWWVSICFASKDTDVYIGMWKPSSSLLLTQVPFNFVFAKCGNVTNLVTRLAVAGNYNVYNLELEQIGVLAHQLATMNIKQQDFCMLRALNLTGLDNYIDVDVQFDNIYDCCFAVQNTNFCKFKIGAGLYTSMLNTGQANKLHFLFNFTPNIVEE